jgi:Fe-Mn family superoxide dismutase
MTMNLSRRRFVGSAAGVVATGVLFAPDARPAAPPKETGLPSEGLLAGRAGFQPRTRMPLPHDELPGFLSKAQLALHYAEYVQLVERLRRAEQSLRTEQVDPATYAELRRTQVAAANGVLLHEFYFTGLAPTKMEPSRYVLRHMDEHMGSLEAWQQDFRRCALAAKAWAVLVYDPYDDRWHNTLMDSDDAGVWIGANPLVVCDVATAAFSTDHQRREDYVAKFLEHIDWEEVARRYRAVDRM